MFMPSASRIIFYAYFTSIGFMVANKFSQISLTQTVSLISSPYTNLVITSKDWKVSVKMKIIIPHMTYIFNCINACEKNLESQLFMNWPYSI